jgi:hypothetical protein
VTVRRVLGLIRSYLEYRSYLSGTMCWECSEGTLVVLDGYAPFTVELRRRRGRVLRRYKV